MNNLILKGEQNFLGVTIPIIEGGFGEDCKVILAKSIAEIHRMELKKVNELIKNNIKEFEEGVDIIDLQTVLSKDRSEVTELLIESGYRSQNIKVSKNIYLLSEQGYMLLVGFMKTEKAKEIRKKLRREYFGMRQQLETINSHNNDLVNMVQNTVSAIMPVITTEIAKQFAPMMLETKQQVKHMAELMHDQSQIYDEDRNELKNLIGFRAVNTKRLVDYIKEKLSEKLGFSVYANHYMFQKVKKATFKRFQVIKWEDISVSRYNATFAFLDTYIDEM